MRTKLNILNKCLQYSLLLGSISWALGSGLVPQDAGYTPGHLEFMSMIFSVGLPAALYGCEIMAPGDKRVKRVVELYCLGASLLLVVAGFALGLPLMLLGGLAALVAMGIIRAGEYAYHLFTVKARA